MIDIIAAELGEIVVYGFRSELPFRYRRDSISDPEVILCFELWPASDEHRYPADHPRSKRAGLSHRTNTTSQVDQLLHSIDMHIANLGISFAELRQI